MSTMAVAWPPTDQICNIVAAFISHRLRECHRSHVQSLGQSDNWSSNRRNGEPNDPFRSYPTARFGGGGAAMRGRIDVTPDFKVGDPCPDGYIARQEWAEVHLKAGLKQEQCGRCSLWFFPHQLSDQIDKCTAHTRCGNQVKIELVICLKCVTVLIEKQP